ncbi:hypothetical protein SNE40_004019 [Patella caerulea]|uniref:Uncharacterized protein n=1 Tax=Patella caerulea TaxID=87958 RepID=A0AAN8Q0W8_PATCE
MTHSTNYSTRNRNQTTTVQQLFWVWIQWYRDCPQRATQPTTQRETETIHQSNNCFGVWIQWPSQRDIQGEIFHGRETSKGEKSQRETTEDQAESEAQRKVNTQREAQRQAQRETFH